MYTKKEKKKENNKKERNKNKLYPKIDHTKQGADLSLILTTQISSTISIFNTNIHSHSHLYVII
jgi:hypothetical protein